MKPAVLSGLFASLTLLVGQGLAQEPPPPPQPQVQALSQGQLENLVAPIALYPDALLSQILVAATYPLEVVEAGQWLQQNRNLRGPDLVAAASQQNWDASVQALVVFPDVVNRLNSDIRWTTDLGNAFLAQQADVMNAVQALRAQAQAAGKLQSNAQQIVTTDTQGPQSVIEIQPADPEIVYVPSYNPEYIWGPPLYGYYPPLYYPAFGFSFGYGIPIGGFFGGLGWGGWGWGPNWFGGAIVQNNFFFSRYHFNGFRGDRFGDRFGDRRPGDGRTWSHNPDHRLGVPYSNSRVANNFRGSTRGGAGFGGGAANGQRFAGSGSASFRGNPAANSFSASPSRQPGSQFRGGVSQSGPSQGWSHFSNNGQRGNVNPGGSRGAQSFRSAPSFSSSRASVSGGGSFQSNLRPNPGAQTIRQSPGPQALRSNPQSFRSSPQTFRSSPQSVRSSPQNFRSSPQSFRSSPSPSGGGFNARSAPSFHSSAPSGGGFRGGSGAQRGGSGGGSRGGGSHSSRR